MELEETGVVKEAEAVGDLPLDLKIGGIEGLSFQWRRQQQANECRQKM